MLSGRRGAQDVGRVGGDVKDTVKDCLSGKGKTKRVRKTTFDVSPERPLNVITQTLS